MDILRLYIEQLLTEVGAINRANIKHDLSGEQETVTLTPTNGDACEVCVWRDHAADTSVVEVGGVPVEFYGSVDAVRDIVLAVIEGTLLLETRIRGGRTAAIRVTWPRADGTQYSLVHNVSLRFWGQAETVPKRCGAY